MKNNIYIFFLFVFFNSLGVISSAQAKKTDTTQYFKPILSYTADAGRNFSGGIAPGNTYMGLIDAGWQFLIPRGTNNCEFLLEFQSSHGHNLTKHYIGDLQVISNIENRKSLYFYQFYYKHHFKKGFLAFGLQDLNLEFVMNESGGDLTNSSFGIPAIFPLNFTVSIYPKNALALTGGYRFSEAVIVRAGIWDGDAGSLDDDPYNTDWTINKTQGLLGITEAEIHINPSAQTLKLGGYVHTADFDSPDTLDLSYSKGSWGGYLLYDIQINEKLGAFAQAGIMPEKYSYNPLYLGTGISTHLFNQRTEDALSLGAAYIHLFDNRYECDIEMNYKFVFMKNFSVRPCLHYIISPSGTLPDAFASFLRITAEL